MGCIEFLPGHTRRCRQDRPSYALFDLDPFHPAGWDDVKQMASLFKVALDELGLTFFPIRRRAGQRESIFSSPSTVHQTFEHVRSFAGTLCHLVHRVDADITTLEWDVSRRADKVCLDPRMNRAEASMVAPYSLRPTWQATACAPFAWEEIDRITRAQFTMATMVERIADVEDLFEPVAAGPGHSLDGSI